MPNNLLPLIAFLSEISRINKNQPHKKFCFILGAGASKSSGIPLAEELVDRWLKQIKIRNPRYKDLDYNNFIIQWGNDLKQPIEINFNNRAEFYSNIYYELYKDNKSLGQAEITNLTEKGHPSIGYLFLAEILKNTHHNTVITTNFDNLIIKALGYSSIYPLVCHLPEMPKYINNYHNGPKINKIHGDVFFQQQHNLNSSLDPIWKNIIDNIFQTHILIIAGYSGNDNTLFSALKTSPHLNNKNNNGSHIYWMHYKGTNKEPSEPSAKIKTLLSEQKGKYVPICGFDELMLLIHNVLSSKEHDPHDFSTYLMDEANKFIDELNHKNNEFISKIQTQIPKLKKNIAKLDTRRTESC